MSFTTDVNVSITHNEDSSDLKSSADYDHQTSVKALHERAEILFKNTKSTTFDPKEQYVSTSKEIDRVNLLRIFRFHEYIETRINNEFKVSEELPFYLQKKIDDSKKKETVENQDEGEDIKLEEEDRLILKSLELTRIPSPGQKVSLFNPSQEHNASKSLIQYQQETNEQYYIPENPVWHAPWKLMRVIAGHQGWVRSLAVEPDNKWFASGSNDNTIKIWDLASGHLKLTLIGHSMTVRDIVISERHPYMFSCSEDKTVKCWDLEKNQVIRDYHGHLSGVYAIDVHPTLDLVVTGSRDSTLKVWDIRTSVPIFTLMGHKNPITKVKCQPTDPQIISTSNDKTIRLWDLAAGKTQTVLTHHRKSIRALTMHPNEYTFATASPDNIKQWKLPEGSFMHNFVPPHQSIVNTLSVNQDNVLFSGGDDGTMSFYDWQSGHKFQELKTTNLPGSLDSEAGIFISAFDKTGLRLITGEADKSIKIWKEDTEATPETHPGIEFDPDNYRQRF